MEQVRSWGSNYQQIKKLVTETRRNNCYMQLDCSLKITKYLSTALDRLASSNSLSHNILHHKLIKITIHTITTNHNVHEQQVNISFINNFQLTERPKNALVTINVGISKRIINHHNSSDIPALFTVHLINNLCIFIPVFH